MLTKKISKVLHYLEVGASGCASGDIEQIIVNFLFKLWLKYIDL